MNNKKLSTQSILIIIGVSALIILAIVSIIMMVKNANNKQNNSNNSGSSNNTNNTSGQNQSNTNWSQADKDKADILADKIYSALGYFQIDHPEVVIDTIKSAGTKSFFALVSDEFYLRHGKTLMSHINDHLSGVDLSKAQEAINNLN